MAGKALHTIATAAVVSQTPNARTLEDFVSPYKAVALDAWGGPIRLKVPWWVWNLFGEQAVFLLSRK